MNTTSICLTVNFYVQDLLCIDVNMVTEFQQLGISPTGAKNKNVGIYSIEKPQ